MSGSATPPTPDIESLFDALFSDASELIDAHYFASSMRDIFFQSDEIDGLIDNRILNAVTLKHAITSFYIIAGRLMDDDNKSYSLGHAVKMLREHKPSQSYLNTLLNIAESATVNDEGKKFEMLLQRWERTATIARDKFEQLKKDYKPIMLCRHNYFAHKGRKTHDQSLNHYPTPSHADKFVKDLISVLNMLSGLFRNATYAFNNNLGKMAADRLIYLQFSTGRQ